MAEQKSSALLLGDLIEGLNQAEGGASQLIHTQGGDPRWMMIRDALSLTKEACIHSASLVTAARVRAK